MDDWITIGGQAISAAINPLGAELSSLRDAAGAEYMTYADPAFWTGRAPVLFPIIGALNHGEYHLGAATYAMGKHGFARHSRFAIVHQADDSVTLRLTDSDETRAIYPFAFVLDLTFRVDAATLHVAATVENPGDAPLPFSLGFHPAFAWPLPGGAAKDSHRVTFAEPEPAPIRRLNGSGLIKPERFATPVDGDVLAPDTEMFKADAMVFDQVVSRALTFGPAGGTQISLDFPDATVLGIWQKPGAAFLCLEPWHGIADPVGFIGDFRDKPEVMELAPGSREEFRMAISLLAS